MRLSDFRVLVVDDEPFIREVCVDLIRMELEQTKERGSADGQYQVMEAASGREAIEIYRRAWHDNQPIHLVVCDIRMPGMDGVTCVEQMLELSRSLQVVFASAYSNYRREDIEDRLGHPVEFLHKPFPMPSLLEQVRKAFRQSRVAGLPSMQRKFMAPLGQA